MPVAVKNNVRLNETAPIRLDGSKSSRGLNLDIERADEVQKDPTKKTDGSCTYGKKMIIRVQGLRGIAIIAVLLFHLWPLNFPNGYIGVDMFFVLSGYLMAMIFSKYDKITPIVVALFYYKRMKRILPLYYFVIPATLICGQFLLNQAWVAMNNRHAFYALMLLKNMETIWNGQDYFDGFHSAAPVKDLFLHSWSLAVEIQFYLVVPFLFIALSYFPKLFYKISILSGISIIACAQYYYSNPIFSFNYPLSRMWQFCSGMISFILFQKTTGLDEKAEELPKSIERSAIAAKAEKWISDWSILLVFIIFMPVTIDNTVLRPLLTFVTVVLLSLQSGFTTKVLENTMLSKIGDISYTLYLVHWPIIVLFKKDDISSYQLTICLTILISLILFLFFEGFYRRLSIRNTIILFGLLMSANVAVYCSISYTPEVQQFLRDFRLRKLDDHQRHIVDINSEYAAHNVREITVGKHCNYSYSESAGAKAFEYPWGICDYPSGHGTKKVIVVGNSYAMNQAHLIYEEFKGNFSSFRLISNKGLQVLYDHFENETYNLYAGQHDYAMKKIEEFKPDYLFICTRYQDIQKAIVNVRNISDDYIVKQYNEKIARLEESTTSKIFIQGSTPFYPMLHLNKYLEAYIEGTDIEKFHLKKLKFDDEMAPGEERLTGVSCKKCQEYNTRQAFLEGDRYLGFDPKTHLSFIDNDIHFTEAGLERLRPVYRKLIRELFL